MTYKDLFYFANFFCFEFYIVNLLLSLNYLKNYNKGILNKVIKLYD